MGLRDLFGRKAAPGGEPVKGAAPYVPRADPDEWITTLARSGEKIEAIKLYREHYGVGLADAKEAVDALARGDAPASPVPSVGRTEGDADVLSLLNDGRLIDAVTLYRQRHGVGLKEAKEAVEAMRG